MAMASIKDLINDIRKLSDYIIAVPEREGGAPLFRHILTNTWIQRNLH